MVAQVAPREIRRRQQELRARIGRQLVELRSELGVSRSHLARCSGIDDGYLRRIELGVGHPSLDTLVSLAVCLGADVGLRLFPTAGPRIRDHLQAPIVEALIGRLNPRWTAIPEFPVPAARGVIDVVLRDRSGGPQIAVEVHSQLRSIDLVLRRLHEKALALAQIDGAGDSSSLLVVRDTTRNREIARLHAATLGASVPGTSREAIAALTGADAEWPGPTLLWARLEKGRAQILDRPPRGVTVGRCARRGR